MVITKLHLFKVSYDDVERRTRGRTFDLFSSPMALVTLQSLTRGRVLDTYNPGLGNRLVQEDVTMRPSWAILYDTTAK